MTVILPTVGKKQFLPPKSILSGGFFRAKTFFHPAANTCHSDELASDDDEGDDCVAGDRLKGQSDKIDEVLRLSVRPRHTAAVE